MAAIDEMFDALQARDLDRVKAIAAADPDVASAVTPGGASALMWAAYGNFQEALDVLHGVHPGLSLAEAAALGDTDRLRDRLEATPEAVNTPGADGWTPLHLAAFFGREEAALLLLRAGAVLAAVAANDTANQPLHAAVAGTRSTELISTLLHLGADVNARAASGITPLHLAAAAGDTELVDLLREHGADATLRMESGQTPAVLAASRGHEEVAHALDHH